MNFSPEITSLLSGLIGVCLGGFLSLTTAIVIAIISNRQQTKRDLQTRQWQIEDVTKEIKRAIFLQRSKEIEQTVSSMHDSLEALIKSVATQLTKGGVTEESLAHLRNAVDSSMKAAHLEAAFIYFNDTELKKSYDEMQLLMSGVGSYWGKKQVEDNKNFVEIMDHLSKSLKKMSAIKASILRRIDELYALI